MPIYIEALAPETMNADDVGAIQTIYQDYPNSTPVERFEAWRMQQLDDNWSLWAARFNDRLLGAAWTQQDDHALSIHDVCVRRITRNRGVARRLFDHLHTLSQSTQHTLSLGHVAESADEHAIVEYLLQHRKTIGFNANT
ncbi:MAG: acetyl-CoA sensor PanZ family protein [Pseudomonadota bacterium]